MVGEGLDWAELGMAGMEPKERSNKMVYEKKYSWRHGKSVSAQVAGEVMEKIEKRDGMLTKEAFLEESRPVDAPTHNLFEWDDTAAAEKFRLEQSRLAIADIVVTIVKADEPVKRHAFVNVIAGKHNKAEYSSIEIAMGDEEKRKAVLQNAFAELKAFEQKYADYKELAGVFSEAHKAEMKYGA